MAKIRWTENPSYRLVIYSGLLSLLGTYDNPYDEDWDAAYDSIAAAMRHFGMEDAAYPNAIKMQHRWCCLSKDLTAEPNAKSIFSCMFANRVAAIQAGYMHVDDAMELFSKNNLTNIDVVHQYLKLAVEDRLEIDVALEASKLAAFQRG